MSRIVLASASATRVGLLRGAGVAFDSRPARIDERAVEKPLIEGRAPPAAIAEALAAAKALAVVAAAPEALVIGADQVLECGGEILHKPPTLDAARTQIASLSGRAHALHSAVAAARGDSIVWRFADTARLTMRPLSAAAIDAYLDEAGDAALSSVGAYQIEGPGIRLFERIEGDYFTILGLPLLPLLAFLRAEGEID